MGFNNPPLNSTNWHCKTGCAIVMEAPIHEIKINEDISFPSPLVTVRLPWLLRKPLGKRRTTLLRKRAIVLGKHEQCISGPAPLALRWTLTSLPWGPSYTPSSHCQSGAGMGKVPRNPDRDFSESKRMLIIMTVSIISLIIASDFSGWIDLVKYGAASQTLF